MYTIILLSITTIGGYFLGGHWYQSVESIFQSTIGISHLGNIFGALLGLFVGIMIRFFPNSGDDDLFGGGD